MEISESFFFHYFDWMFLFEKKSLWPCNADNIKYNNAIIRKMKQWQIVVKLPYLVAFVHINLIFILYQTLLNFICVGDKPSFRGMHINFDFSHFMSKLIQKPLVKMNKCYFAEEKNPHYFVIIPSFYF